MWELSVEKTKTIAMAVAILCCAGPALAQDINPSWYIQPSANAFKPDTDFGVHERDYGGGFKIGKPVHPLWDVQMGASHSRAESDNNLNEYRQTLLGVDALLMMSRGRIRPFLLFGVGAQRDDVRNALGRVRETSPYATAGLGVQMALTDRLSLQADLRTVRGRLREEERFGFSTNNNRYLTIGLNWALSPPPPPPAPPAPPAAPVVQEPAPVPAPVAPAPPPRFEKVTLSTLELFDFDSATLRLPQTRLDDIAAALQADPSITDVDITGYADRLGSTQYNLKLSQRRADAVRTYLVGRGVEGGRLKAYGRGEANPIVTCNNKRRADLIKCLEPNRRVEVEQITIERRVQ
jgi:OOP family OmpA-OmpF porin